MKATASQTSILIVVAVLGTALGLGSYTFAYARLGVHDRRRSGVREPPCHERAIRRLDQEQSPLCRGVQRLSRAPLSDRQVCDEGPQRFWHSYTFRQAPSRSQSGRCRRAWRSRKRTVAVATSPSSRRWERPRTPDLAISSIRCHGSVGHMELSRPTSQILRGEPCAIRNQAAFAAGVAAPFSRWRS